MIAYTQYNPGIYSISNEEYHSSSGISRSGIVEFKHCPKKFWNKYLNPYYIKPEPTKALNFGNAFHTAILEPHEYDNRYISKPDEKIMSLCVNLLILSMKMRVMCVNGVLQKKT